MSEGDVIMRDPHGPGKVVLVCPMDAELAGQIMRLCARAGYAFDTDAMRAEGTPMPDRSRLDENLREQGRALAHRIQEAEHGRST